jgi:hypothetical protein
MQPGKQANRILALDSGIVVVGNDTTHNFQFSCKGRYNPDLSFDASEPQHLLSTAAGTTGTIIVVPKDIRISPPAPRQNRLTHHQTPVLERPVVVRPQAVTTSIEHLAPENHVLARPAVRIAKLAQDSQMTFPETRMMAPANKMPLYSAEVPQQHNAPNCASQLLSPNPQARTAIQSASLSKQRGPGQSRGGSHSQASEGTMQGLHPTPLFQRLVSEEVQELKSYARIIESQNRRLVELERVHGDLEARLELQSTGKMEIERTLEVREQQWSKQIAELEKDREHWKAVVEAERTKNSRLMDQVVRKDQDIHRMLQRKVRRTIVAGIPLMFILILLTRYHYYHRYSTTTRGRFIAIRCEIHDHWEIQLTERARRLLVENLMPAMVTNEYNIKVLTRFCRLVARLKLSANGTYQMLCLTFLDFRCQAPRKLIHR